MPLISFRTELERAREEGYALPCFIAVDSITTEAIVSALEKKRAPGILGIHTSALDLPRSRGLASMARSMAEDARVPISVILDHGPDLEHCMKALSYGFSDVMYDGSQLPLDENIANSSIIARSAHAIGASLEVELGHVGSGARYESFGSRGEGFTKPEDAERFVEETGADSLAVAIGTAHGAYKGEPKLDLDRLEKIRARIDTPLALHGGSGLSDDQFQTAIARGVAKINIFTNLAVIAAKAMAESGAANASYFDITRAGRTAFAQECERFIDVFGATDKA